MVFHRKGAKCAKKEFRYLITAEVRRKLLNIFCRKKREERKESFITVLKFCAFLRALLQNNIFSLSLRASAVNISLILCISAI